MSKLVYSERLQMLLDYCDRYRAPEKKLEEQGVECDPDRAPLEVDDSLFDKPSEKTPSP